MLQTEGNVIRPEGWHSSALWYTCIRINSHRYIIGVSLTEPYIGVKVLPEAFFVHLVT